MTSSLQPLEHHLQYIRHVSNKRGYSEEVLAERIRVAEIMWYHAQAGFIEPMFLTRAFNFMCNPELWDDWKQRGGDDGLFS